MPTQDDSAFTVAEGARAGLTRWALDSPIFERPFHGLRAAPGLHDIDDHPAASERRAIALAARRFAVYMHQHEFFSHMTAGVLWGIALPRTGSTDIDVSVLAPHRAPAGAGVRGHQLAASAVRVTVTPGLPLPVTDPATTWALLGARLRHPYDLVAAADSLLRVDRRPGPGSRVLAPAMTTIGELRAAIPRRRRGVVALREALPRVRAGSASRMETWMRLTIVDAGLPEPVLDHDVYDDDGRFLGCVDGAYRRHRIALEYEGDHHRTDAAQWQRDIVKHDDLVRAGWRVIRVTRTQLMRRPADLVARVREALTVAPRVIDLR